MPPRHLENVAEGGGEQSRLLGGGDPARFDIKRATDEVRKGFVRKVYGVLTGQLILTALIAYVLYQAGQDRSWLHSHEWLLWVSVIMTVSSICVMACCENLCRRYPTNYFFLFTFTAFEAVMIGFISAMYSWQGVLLATGVTMAVFLLLTVFAFSAGLDFTGSGPYLFIAIMMLLVFGLVLSVLGLLHVRFTWATVLYDALAVLIFSFYIVFDTQLMLGQWGGHRTSFSVDDYVFAALNLYMDIVNLFIHLLSLLGSRND